MSNKVINIKDTQVKEEVKLGNIGFTYASDLFDSAAKDDPFAMGYRQAYKGLKKENPFIKDSDQYRKYNEGYASYKAEMKSKKSA